MMTPGGRRVSLFGTVGMEHGKEAAGFGGLEPVLVGVVELTFRGVTGHDGWMMTATRD